MLEFAPLREWAAVLREHRIPPRYWPRVALHLAVATATTPLRVYESLRHGTAVRATPLHPSPLFVLGCARSGTTHLHNLLALDPQFTCVSTFQALFEPFALSGSTWLKPLLDKLGPASRPMDNVTLTMSSPQEEDVALAHVTRRSGLHCNTFPRAHDRLFRDYVLGEAEGEDLRAWRDAWLDVLRKATLAGGGRRLVLKSPTNTGKVDRLLEMFPDARFVHIHRDPYKVFLSLVSAARKVTPHLCYQPVDWDRLEEGLTDFYVRTLRKYLADRDAIPAGHHAEVRFDDLQQRPLDELERLYDELGLGDWTAVRPRVEEYLASLGTYEKNVYEIDARVVEHVNREMGFAFEAFGYERRG